MKQNFSNIFMSEADRFDQNIAKWGEEKNCILFWIRYFREWSRQIWSKHCKWRGRKKLYTPLNQADLIREVMIFSDYFCEWSRQIWSIHCKRRWRKKLYTPLNQAKKLYTPSNHANLMWFFLIRGRILLKRGSKWTYWQEDSKKCRFRTYCQED